METESPTWPVDLPIIGQVVRASNDEPYLAVVIGFDSAVIADLLLQMPPEHDVGPEPEGLTVSVAPNNLLDPVVRLLRLLDHQSDVPVLAPMLKREIIWRLLNGEQRATVRAIGMARSRVSQIGRAIQWIRTHYAEPLQMSELADVAAMGTSTLFRNFRAVTSMSPLQFQKQVRLHEARAQLMARAKDVAAIAFDVGYSSTSQFSREYRRLFGTPPGMDARRLRAQHEIDEELG